MSSNHALDKFLDLVAEKRLAAAAAVPYSIATTILGVLFIAVMFWASKPHQRLIPGVPIVGGKDAASIKKNRLRFVHDSMRMLQEGYAEAKGGVEPYYVPSKLGERLMLPTKYLEDLKSAPVHEVDFVATFIEVWH